jgi:signal transduction histidine kinase
MHTVTQFGLLIWLSRLETVGLRLFPLLFIILVMRSCLMFGQRGRLVVTFLAFLLFIGFVQARLRSPFAELPFRLGQRLFPLLLGVSLNLVAMFAILLVLLLLLMNALITERDRQLELQRANEKLRASAAQIEKLAMAQERSRIARDIHDSLGHALTGLNIQLESVIKLWPQRPDQAHQFLVQAKEMGSLALQEARQAVAALRDVSSLQGSLSAEILGLAKQFQTLTGIHPDIQVACPPLPPALQVTIYRLVQEALTNACKYAQATAVTVSIQKAIAPAPGLQIRVEDNGVGFQPGDNTTGFGLRGIQERAEAEGGTFQVISAPGAGCTVEVWLPLPEERA